MSDVVNLKDYTVITGGETYSMVKIPDEKSGLVVQARGMILQNLTLDKVTTNLDRAGKLIFVAYNGVARAPKLRGAVISLSDNLGRLSAECELTMQGFQTGSTTILKNLKDVFNFLVKGKEEAALKFLNNAGQAARAMSNKAETLAGKFENLGNDAVGIAADAAVEEGNEEARRLQYEADMADFEAKTEGAKTLVEKLKESKAQLQELIEQVTSKAETAENRAFALSIVSAITKPIGEGIGAFAGVYTRSQMPSNLPPSTPWGGRDYYDAPPPRRSSSTTRRPIDDDDAPPPRRSSSTTRRPVDDDDPVYGSSRRGSVGGSSHLVGASPPTRRATDDDDDDAPPQRRSTTTRGRDDDDDDDAPPQRRSTTTRGRDDDDDDDDEDRSRSTTRDEGLSPEEKEAIIESTAETLEGIGDTTGKMGEDFYGLLASYREERQHYLELLHQQQKEEREALAAIAEYAVRMSHLTAATEIVKAARDSLHQAVGALKEIIVALRVASTFWQQMANYCEELAKSDLQDKIDVYKDEPIDERIAFYVEEDFKLEVVSYLAAWQALAVVCREYSAVCAQVTERIYADFMKNPSIEQSIRDTPQLAAELLASATAEMEASDAMGAAIDAELAAEQEAA